MTATSAAELAFMLVSDYVTTAGARGVTLKFESPSPVSCRLRQAWRMRITASNAVSMPAEIFVHRRTEGPDSSPDGPSLKLRDEFSHVASPPELESLPAGGPAAGAPWFRTAVCDLLFDSSRDLAEGSVSIKKDVEELAAALDRLDVLSESVEVRIGGAP
mgnify:CR=1 FL=1